MKVQRWQRLCTATVARTALEDDQAMHPADALNRPDREGLGEARGVVVTYSPAGRAHARLHERAVQASLGRTLAALLGYDFAGEYDPSGRYPGRVYFVPSETLLSGEARALGVRGEGDLFGGVVPHPFVATKTITHPLVEADPAAPPGWSHSFARRVRDVVLPGFSAFTPGDARRAGACLLGLGPVRIKPARGCGWRGQVVVAGLAELEAALSAVDPEELRRHGLVLEQDLRDVTTYSVGQVRVADLRATYHGTQRVTTDNAGAAVYGGSDLLVVRGDYDDVLGLDLAPEVRLAVNQARAYDDAATQEFPGLLASRRNYDVLRGYAEGRCRGGVLEQSWRVGGASGPEVAALEAFSADPALRVARAWCIEAYGTAEPPPHARVHFRGVDERLGPLTKYTVVQTHDTTR
jgi:hypothetical protein